MLPARHADRPRRSQCLHGRPERAGAGEVRLGRHTRGDDDAAGVYDLGVPRHGHLARRPYRGRGRAQGPDQDAAHRAPHDREQQVQLRPPGGQRRGHRDEQVHHGCDQERCGRHHPLEDAEPSPGAHGVRRLLRDGAHPVQVQAGPLPGLLLRRRRHQRPRDLLGRVRNARTWTRRTGAGLPREVPEEAHGCTALHHRGRPEP
mmetsp:Transcript_40192/g.106407  ORF Transcript_40192/g.106407 Transcript_40192/m.106407 type:complete len:203 (-) Transcript_40192:489-1097(-)